MALRIWLDRKVLHRKQHFSKKNLQNAVKTALSMRDPGDSVTFGHLGTKLIFTAHRSTVSRVWRSLTRISNTHLLPFALLSLICTCDRSTTRLRWDLPLEKITFILLHSLTFPKIYIIIYLFICLNMCHDARKHALDFWITWVPGKFRFSSVAFTWKLTGYGQYVG